MNQETAQLLQQIGIEKSDLSWTTQVVLILAILLVSYLTTLIFRHLIMPAVRKITARTKATWDDYLFNDKMMKASCRMIPPITWYILLPFAFDDKSAYLLQILLKISLIYLIITALMLIKCFLDSLYEISSEHEALKNRPLKGIYQMINLISIGVGIILIISVLIDRNATAILTGLGASAAILMLIFKDSILGLVAGIQLSANDMLRPGDWITMTKYGADGYVIEVSLTDYRKSTELRQDHHHHSSLRTGQRFLPKLERHARMWRSPHQTLAVHRHDYRAFLYTGGSEPIRTKRMDNCSNRRK